MYYLEFDIREDVVIFYFCYRILFLEWQQVFQDGQIERDGFIRYQSCGGGIVYKGGGRLKGNIDIYIGNYICSLYLMLYFIINICYNLICSKD